DGIAVAREPGVIFTCFGDMMRVPGSAGTLLEAKAEGADVRMVYSPLDALRIARQNPERDVVFFAIGFETTAPSTALTLRRAKAEGVPNFCCFGNHVTIVPPLRALLESPDLRLDGFVGPGHVSTVVGARPFEFIPADYRKPVVISGFEPLDLLQSAHMVLRQLAEGRCEVENQYKRVVPYDGNPRALEVLAQVFELRPHFEWRGLGFIAHSGLKVAPAYADVDGLALTTDSFVVKPLRFPGGSIGELAVNGTVNDLAVAGARPLALTLSLVLEEGLPAEDLRAEVDAIAAAAAVAGVRVVGG